MDRRPSPIMHRAEKKFEIGQISDEQQQFREILNKLNPQNFDRVFKQVIEVNINRPDILAGLVSQIVDKAILEPTYCEIYADLCSHLAFALPGFFIDNKKITFKGLLLKKCQEEFERRGREEAEVSKIKQTREESAEKRLKAKKRALGNIQLIGELYKRRMLSELIIHMCIKKLLGTSQNPDEENIEALCKLLSIIGEMIDDGRPKATKHMDAYFDTMEKLSMNQRYSSPIHFMLKDIIDLRKNKWQQQGDGSGFESEIEEIEEEGEVNQTQQEREEERLKAIKRTLLKIHLSHASELFMLKEETYTERVVKEWIKKSPELSRELDKVHIVMEALSKFESPIREMEALFKLGKIYLELAMMDHPKAKELMVMDLAFNIMVNFPIVKFCKWSARLFRFIFTVTDFLLKAIFVC